MIVAASAMADPRVTAALVAGGVALVLCVVNVITARRLAKRIEELKAENAVALENHKQVLKLRELRVERNVEAVREAYASVQKLRDELYRLVSPRGGFKSAAEAKERLSNALYAVQVSYAERAADLWPQRAAMHAAKRFTMDVAEELLSLTERIDSKTPLDEGAIRRVQDARELLGGVQALLCAATIEDERP